MFETFSFGEFVALDPAVALVYTVRVLQDLVRVGVVEEEGAAKATVDESERVTWRAMRGRV